jgi:hypothetical protein
MRLTYIDGVTIKTSWTEFCKSNPRSKKFLTEVKDALFESGIYHGGGNGKKTYTLISPRDGLR